MSNIEELLSTWADPPAIFRSAPFWSWNAALDPQRLCREIDSMHDAGMGGAFMHSRYGLKTPYLSAEWFACVSACAERCRQRKMHAYLYDEDRWPSGAAGGLVTRDNVEFRLHELVCTTQAETTKGGERLGSFAVRRDEAGRLVSYEPLEAGQAAPAGAEVLHFDVVSQPTGGWYNDGAYLDTMSAEAVGEFIQVTHQAYADRHAEDFGTVVPAIFTDEPNYFQSVARRIGLTDGVPWTADMARQFRARRGYDVREHLPELLYAGPEGEFSRVRHDFRRTATELFVESYSRQIGQWCARLHIASTGHMLSEQTLASQITAVGACMPHYEHMQWPGIDILTDQADELATAKQCASVADQLGHQRVLSELYGCTGWDWPLEGHKFVGDWQFAAGVNFRCPHLVHYSLAGGAKRDYPAMFAHTPWWKHYKVVEDYFARLGFMLTRGQPVRDVLVIHPVESAWGCFHDGPPAEGDEKLISRLDESLRRLIYALSGGHYDWDFADEGLLARHGEATAKGLKVGRLTYKAVVVPPSITLRSSTVEMLARFAAAGGTVLFVGRVPDRVDAEDGQKAAPLAELIARCRTCGEDRAVAALEAVLPRRVSVTEGSAEQNCVWTMLRKITGGQVLFVQSHDRKAAHTVRVRVAGRGPAVLWDLRSGERTRLEQTADEDGHVSFELVLPPTGTALVTLGLPLKGAAKPPPPRKVVESRSAAGPFDIELAEPNTAPLDWCSYAAEGEGFSAEMHSLKADKEIRARFGLGTRLGGEHQPWYLYAMGTVDTAPRGGFRLRRRFHVTDLPARCLLAVERPEDFRITVNGKPAPEASGWWVDQDIRTIDVTSLLVAGDNEVLMAFDYRPDMEIEDMYLVGEFGVRTIDGGAPRPGNVTLTAPPRRLGLGSWVGQGLDFYGGGVLYRMSVSRPAGGRRLRVRLGGVACACAVVHVGARQFVLPWAPFEADITDALAPGDNVVAVEVIGGRKNILGPLHTPWGKWTGPGQFSPDSKDWTDEYLLNPHGLTAPVIVETLE